MKTHYVLKSTLKCLKRNGFRKDLVFSDNIHNCNNCVFLSEIHNIKNVCTIFDYVVQKKFNSICSIHIPIPKK